MAMASHSFGEFHGNEKSVKTETHKDLARIRMMR